MKAKGDSGMKVTIAIDSFKGSLSSLQAGDAVREGILRVYGDDHRHGRRAADRHGYRPSR